MSQLIAYSNTTNNSSNSSNSSNYNDNSSHKISIMNSNKRNDKIKASSPQWDQPELLHSGQKRFHSFYKLRQIHTNNVSQLIVNSLNNTNGNNNNNTNTINNGQLGSHLYNYTYTQTQSRSMSIMNFLLGNIGVQSKLKQLEREAIRNPNDTTVQLNFLSSLLKVSPDSAIEYIRKVYFSGSSSTSGNSTAAPPMLSTDIAILYLQLLHSQNKIKLLDVEDIIKRVQQSTGNPNMYNEYKQMITSTSGTTELERKLSKSEHAQYLYSFLVNGTGTTGAAIGGGIGIGGGAASNRMRLGTTPLGMVTPGATQSNPVHVQVVSGGGFGTGGRGSSTGTSTGMPISFRGMLFNSLDSLLRLSVGLVIGGAIIMAMVDSSGIGKGMPGMGGSTFSKHIQETDQDGTVNGNKKKIKFDDVKGVAEAKAELEEIVEYLKDPTKFTRLGGTLPRGVLLTGPPGTGKTLLAKAVAGEAEVPFFYSSGSQFEEVYVGLGAKRIRELFETAKKKAPAIIFIDEIDAVGGTRKLKDQSALKMTLNELLVQLDGFDENNGIIVIGATNFMESLDTALLRPGRFDKHVVVPLPDVGGRKEILEMYASKTKLTNDADLNVLARGTTGMSGADLYNLINQAALKASIDGLNAIDMKTLEYAKDKILMGSERKTAVITAETAKMTAYHEAGHAIVALLTKGAMPVHKATIMPRGNSLGMVTMLPESDQTSQSYQQMIAFLDIAMGGRVAEELIFGKDHITSGAASDISSATRLARNMVTKYGFSDVIGIVYHSGTVGEDSASTTTRDKIDDEVKRLTDEAYVRAKELLTKYHTEHILLAETLLEYETLTGDEVRDIVLHKKKPNRTMINKNSGARGDPNLILSNTKNNNTAGSGVKGKKEQQQQQQKLATTTAATSSVDEEKKENDDNNKKTTTDDKSSGTRKRPSLW